MTADPQPILLLKKCSVPFLWYPGYPEISYRGTSPFSREEWINVVKETFAVSNKDKGISLNIHLPFCESSCAYCTRPARITNNHTLEIPYLQAIIKEWEHYKKIFGKKPVVRNLHVGGGTPTFFREKNLQWLISIILEDVDIHPGFEFSFEGHPNNTTKEHLQILFDLGFRRVSFGVQDLSKKVKGTIRRIQPFENLKRVTSQARDIGYTFVSYDFTIGLPFQTLATVTDTIEKVLTLRPDHISFCSYSPLANDKNENNIEDSDLPSNVLKIKFYEIGFDLLTKNNYVDIGMDQFTHGSLIKTSLSGSVYRNLAGFNSNCADLIVGLGASAFSESNNACAQNIEDVETYEREIKLTGSAVFKGHFLSDEELLRKKCIRQIIFKGELSQNLLMQVLNPSIDFINPSLLDALIEKENEGILSLSDGGMKVTAKGKHYITDICKVFDEKMNNQYSSLGSEGHNG